VTPVLAERRRVIAVGTSSRGGGGEGGGLPVREMQGPGHYLAEEKPEVAAAIDDFLA
jgi:hypothetical protein